jgi:hypothetical protein
MFAYDHCTCNGCDGNSFCEDCEENDNCYYDDHAEWQTRCWQGVCGKCTGCSGCITSCEDCGQKDVLGCIDSIEYHFYNKRDRNRDNEWFGNYLTLQKNVVDTWDESFFIEDVNDKKNLIIMVMDMVFSNHQIEFKLYNGDSVFVIGGYGEEYTNPSAEDFEQDDTAGWNPKEDLIKDRNYYQKVLDLPLNFTKSELKQRYREKSAQYHPDKVNSLGLKLRKLAEDEMIDINNAYNELQQYCSDF